MEPRKINKLLSLDTYQGMSDAEIELIIEYKIRRSLSSHTLIAQTIAETERMERCIADNQAAASKALDMIESMVTRELSTIPVVQPNSFTPRSVEV